MCTPEAKDVLFHANDEILSERERQNETRSERFEAPPTVCYIRGFKQIVSIYSLRQRCPKLALIWSALSIIKSFFWIKNVK